MKKFYLTLALITLILCQLILVTTQIGKAQTGTNIIGTSNPTPTVTPINSFSSDSNGDPNAWSMFGNNLCRTSFTSSNGPMTNKVLWTYQLGGNWSWSSSPAVANGIFYTGSDDGNMYALNATTGTKLWNYQLLSFYHGMIPCPSSPSVADGIVYFGSNLGGLFALNATTGRPLWIYPVFVSVSASPAIANGILYCTWSGEVYALNASTGDKIWSFKAGKESSIPSPAVANGIVYIVDGDYENGRNNIFALNATTGKNIWQSTSSHALASTPVVANGVVYIDIDTDNSPDIGKVIAFDAKTGTQLWDFKLERVWSAPAIANGVLYVNSLGGGSSVGYLYALNATTGSKIWSYPTGGSLEASPAVANDIVYVCSRLGVVYAFNAKTGDQVWSFTTGQDMSRASPAVAYGILFTISNDGEVYAFSAATSVALSTSAQTETTISLSWTKTNDWLFTRYDVYYATSVNGPWTLWETITDSSMTYTAVNNLKPNTNYFFKVDDTGSFVGTSSSNTLQATTKSNPTLEIDSRTSTTVSIRWTCYNTYSSQVPFNSYTIQMSTSGSNGPWTPLTTITASSQTTHKITGLNPGMYYIRVYDTVGGVSDGVPATSSYSNALPFSLISVSTTPNNATTITQGQSFQFSALPSGGTGSYNYQWYLNGSIISGATSANYTVNQTWGTYNFYVIIQDAQYPTAQATSSTVQVTVNPPPLAVVLNVPTNAKTLGDSIILTTTVTGGTGSYIYSWYINNIKQSATTSNFTLTPSQVGNYAVYVTVNDATSSAIAMVSSDVNTISISPIPTPSPTSTTSPKPSASPSSSSSPIPIPTAIPTQNPTSTPTVPETTTIILIPIFTALFFIMLIFRRNKKNQI